MNEDKKMNIFEKMSKATDEIGIVKKNLKIGTGKSEYKAVADRDIIEAVKKVEKDNGIYSFPVDRKVIEASKFVVKNDYGEKEQFFIRVETTYRFVNVETPEEFIEVKGYGDGIDTQDKAPGKAVTYSDKYCLMKAYKIETGDDLDANPSDDLFGHNIFKIKQRIEQLITAKNQSGLSMPDMYSSLDINEKQFNAIMKYFDILNSFENKIAKL